ncbi:class I SAM-dependent methyltransferase [Gallaecimonas sp. GXIMD4217]|uniref:class I SAM-dependent methyltransferase n=1 Tax=Gallaecimonas sp. GXIMD4217 TaxID=3131927 RepID=UPI00311B0A45
MTAIYDKIGDGYDITRRADPGILAALISHLAPVSTGKYLDVACGTGNYTAKLGGAGGTWYAVDQSETMLAEARLKAPGLQWRHGDVERLPFQDDCFDGATCTLAIHHFPDLDRAFAEIARVITDQGRFVLFTSTPEQMRGYWLNHYFPDMMARSGEQMPSLERVERALALAGMTIDRVQPFFIEPGLQDFFLYSGKQRPAMYLSEQVRNGISSFRNLCSKHELQGGLARLEADIASGDIRQVMADHENDLGDYCFVLATKAGPSHEQTR